MTVHPTAQKFRKAQTQTNRQIQKGKKYFCRRSKNIFFLLEHSQEVNLGIPFDNVIL